ncbi:MAG: outer membrane beta-barrel protein, partial [Crocinitomicaceae bacterium]
DYTFAMSGAGGIGGLFLYDDKIGASIEFLIGNHKGKYNGTNVLDNQKYSSSINLKTLQIPLLFRLDNEEGYLEIGPQLNVITNAIYKSNYPLGINSDVSEEYKRISFSGVLGFGSFHQLGRRSPVTVTFGFRINYGFSDIKGVDPIGIPYSSLPANQQSIFLAAGFNLGLLYELK